MGRILTSSSLAILIAPAFAQKIDVHPDELALQPKIEAAIAKGVESLINRQLRDGTWGQYGNFVGGKTALCAYALLKCGVHADHPAVRRALIYLDAIEPTQTYCVASMLLAYAATGQAKYRERMEKLTRLLISFQKGGDFGYPQNRADLSNTQYAALGLWVAQKHKIEVPTRVWVQLLNSTLRYNGKRTRVDAPQTGEHTVRNGGKMEIAGFSYRPEVEPTGSMTTAGVAILQICRLGLGSKAGGNLRKIERAVEAGVNWLGHHFTVEKNPNKKDWHYYFLYGLERVGSLTRVEVMGHHRWYVEGARYLVDKQRDDGSWPGSGPLEDLRTAFALLFLRRATQLDAAETGKASSHVAGRHLFAAGTKKDDVAISAAGQQPLAMWITGFGEALLERHRQYGLRIVQVEYLEGDRVLRQLAGKPTQAWHSDAFLHNEPALPRGAHKLRARVQLVAPEVAKGGLTPTETVLSPEMTVSIRDVFAGWMEASAKAATGNLIRGIRLEATASSSPRSARQAVDGKEGTAWVCGSADPDPTLTVELKKAVLATGISIGQAASRAADAGKFDRILAVELRINKDKPVRITLDPDPLAVTTHSLGKGRQVRSLSLRIVERVRGARGGQAGFSEIALTR